MAYKLRTITFGNTSFCNSSCIYCPVNKPYHKNIRRIMDLELFRRIIDELSGEDFIAGPILFGLYNEPLTDPYLNERLDYINTRLPYNSVSITTNGSIYNEEVKKIIKKLKRLYFHCSSVVEDTYNKLMPPLKYSEVMNNIKLMASQFHEEHGSQAQLNVPLNSYNKPEVNLLKEFCDQNNIYLNTFPVSNRAGELRSFSGLSYGKLASHPCCEKILYDIAIDWDGRIPICCQDFNKAELMFDLKEGTLLEYFRTPRFHKVMDDLAKSKYQKYICKNCVVDTGVPR